MASLDVTAPYAELDLLQVLIHLEVNLYYDATRVDEVMEKIDGLTSSLCDELEASPDRATYQASMARFENGVYGVLGTVPKVSLYPDIVHTMQEIARKIEE